jgi:glycosyltransferase involved in cell wall biosynthesis
LSYEGAVAPGKGAARIARAKVYVLPSHGEVFPVTVLEALAAGTAVVLTQDCGIADRLRDADAASVSDGTPTDLAAHVSRLLEDRELLEGRAERGRGLIEGELGVGAMVDDVERHYVHAKEHKDRPNVLWVTNQAAPYRIPVWEALAERVNLEVWLLESDRTLHRDRNNRGTDWEVGDRHFRFSVRTIHSFAIQRGEARHYISGWIGRNPFRNVDAVLIGGWDSPAYWSIARKAARAGVRRIGFYESHLLTQRNTSGFFAAARRWFFRSLDGIVVPGVAARNALLHDGISADRISVGFNAVDVHRIHDDTRLEREHHPRTDENLRLLVVSQLIERKNVAEAIRALKEPGLESARLTIVGTGPLRGQLDALIAELGLNERVDMLGYVHGAEMPKIFAQHDALIHPAIEEVWGLVVNEALAAGLRVVVSDRCGIAPSVRHMKGVTVISTDRHSIAEATRLIVPNRPVAGPEILANGPRPFARIFGDALVPASSDSSRSPSSFTTGSKAGGLDAER